MEERGDEVLRWGIPPLGFRDGGRGRRWGSSIFLRDGQGDEGVQKGDKVRLLAPALVPVPPSRLLVLGRQ